MWGVSITFQECEWWWHQLLAGLMLDTVVMKQSEFEFSIKGCAFEWIVVRSRHLRIRDTILLFLKTCNTGPIPLLLIVTWTILTGGTGCSLISVVRRLYAFVACLPPGWVNCTSLNGYYHFCLFSSLVLLCWLLDDREVARH
jgi:hypothetical protein